MRKILIILCVFTAQLGFAQFDSYTIKIDSIKYLHKKRNFSASVNDFIIDGTTVKELEKIIGKGKKETELYKNRTTQNFRYRAVWCYYNDFETHSRVYYKKEPLAYFEGGGAIQKVKRFRRNNSGRIRFISIIANKPIYIVIPTGDTITMKIGETSIDNINSQLIKKDIRYVENEKLIYVHYFNRLISIQYENNPTKETYRKVNKISIGFDTTSFELYGDETKLLVPKK